MQAEFVNGSCCSPQKLKYSNKEKFIQSCFSCSATSRKEVPLLLQDIEPYEVADFNLSFKY